MSNTSLISTLPGPDAYREITSRFKSERPLCGFYFILDGYPETAHKPSYGFAGGKVPMLWRDFAGNSMSQLVEWHAVKALTPQDLDGALSLERAKAAGSGHVWMGDNELVRSLIIGEKFISSRDAIAATERPCQWLPNLAWQCKENEHAKMAERESHRSVPSLSEPTGSGTWPVELLEPTARQHVIHTPAGSPDHLIVGLAIREEVQDRFTDRAGSEFCLTLHATSDDPQAWGHLEFFVELYAGFYEKQVAPFIGSPFRLYPAIDHVFRRIEDLSGIRSAGDLPTGEAEDGKVSIAEEEIRTNMASFIDQACEGQPRPEEQAAPTEGRSIESTLPQAGATVTPAKSKEEHHESSLPMENAKPVVDCLRESDLTFTETPGLAATRIEFSESGRQQVVCVVTDPSSPSMAGHGRIAVYSAVKDGVSAEDLLKVMGAVGSAAPIGGFRVDDGRLIYQTELPASTGVSDLERVVLTCARIADACESMLTGGSDEH